jgi:hypothetical protein
MTEGSIEFGNSNLTYIGAPPAQQHWHFGLARSRCDHAHGVPSLDERRTHDPLQASQSVSISGSSPASCSRVGVMLALGSSVALARESDRSESTA